MPTLSGTAQATNGNRRHAPVTVAVAAVLVLGLAGCANSPTPQEPAVKEPTGDLARRMEIARTVMAGGNPREAARLYERILRNYSENVGEDHPEIGRVRLERGRALLAAGATYEAIAAFEAIQDRDAYSSAAHAGLGRAYVQLRRPGLALNHFEEALEADPNAVDAINGKGVALAMQGRLEAARDSFTRAVEKEVGFIDARSNEALTYALEGQTERAIEILETLSGRDDAPARIRQNLALVYGLAGRRADAQRLLLQDFGTEAVKSNLAFYAMLRGLDSPGERARALFGEGKSRAEPQPTRQMSREALYEIERLLAKLDFKPGTVDGWIDKRTRAAIREFQKIAGLDVTGQPSEDLLTELRVVAARIDGKGDPQGPDAS